MQVNKSINASERNIKSFVWQASHSHVSQCSGLWTEVISVYILNIWRSPTCNKSIVQLSHDDFVYILISSYVNTLFHKYVYVLISDKYRAVVRLRFYRNEREWIYLFYFVSSFEKLHFFSFIKPYGLLDWIRM